jgi:ABC-2 type transport system permease protein
MFNLALYKKEMKGSLKMIGILGAVLTLYIWVIIAMYDPEAMALLDGYVEMLPELMAAVGMTAGATSLTGFLASYLYGFLLLVFPMIFSILTANKLIARYVDRGSMVCLVAAPVKRSKLAATQAAVLLSGIFALTLFAALLELVVGAAMFPNDLEVGKLLLLNFGLLCVQLFIGGICFLSSCFFSDARYSVGVGAGVPIFMFVLQMLANTGSTAVKYTTFFSLFNPSKIIAADGLAIAGIFVLLAGAVGLFAAAVAVFCKKDLHI